MPGDLGETAVIRREAPGDEPSIHRVHLLAFSSSAEPDLVDALRRSGSAVLSLVAEIDGEIVGHVLFSRLDAPMRALALAPVGVLPERQGRGVGSLLIRTGLREAQKEGWSAVFVVGDPAYYERFGFNVGAAESFQSPYAGEFFQVCLFDASGPRQGAIAYPAPFAAME